jgi:hypothetical protein
MTHQFSLPELVIRLCNSANGGVGDGNEGGGAAGAIITECVVGHAVFGSQPVEVVIRG